MYKHKRTNTATDNKMTRPPQLTGCCSKSGVNWSFDLTFLGWVESRRSLVERESAAARRQNRDGGTFTCSLGGPLDDSITIAVAAALSVFFFGGYHAYMYVYIWLVTELIGQHTGESHVYPRRQVKNPDW